MSDTQTQISAYISRETRELLERYVEAHGVTKGFLIESALLHHLQALQELPADVVIPPRLLLSADSGRAVLERLEQPRDPSPAMRALFADSEGADDDGL